VEKVVPGASQRLGSLAAGLDELNDEVKIVVTHDATRPCVTPEQISLTIKSAKRYGTGITATRADDAVKQVDKGQIVKKTLDRTKLWITNSPQSFKIEVLRDGLTMAKRKGVTIGDDSEAAELVSNEVRLVPSTMPNIRIETADDLSLAGALLRL
jgi:2-C-methyl-D-erythritol 4-phosphate cytidylyltransferase